MGVEGVAPQVVEGVEPLVVEGVEVEVEVVAVVAVAPAYVTVLVSLTYEWSQESSFWSAAGRNPADWTLAGASVPAVPVVSVVPVASRIPAGLQTVPGVASARPATPLLQLVP